MKVNVYIDGFNFYYSAVKRTRYKWMDLRERSLPGHTVHRIKYFTARVKPTPQNPGQQQRQDIYLRALNTLPNFNYYLDSFRIREKHVEVLPGYPGAGQIVRGTTREEKGSDVNLATELLVDGFRGDYEGAVIISDDSDLIAAIQAVRRYLGLKVGILNPQPSASPGRWVPKRRRKLINAVIGGRKSTAWFYDHLDPGHFPHCQLPNPVIDANGIKIYKPRQW